MSKYQKVAVPAARSSLPVLKIRRRIVLVLLLLSAAAGLFAGYAWLTTPAVVIPDIPDAANPSVALAEQVARDYMSGRPTAVSVAAGVSPTFGYDPAKPTPVPGWDGSLDLAGVDSTTDTLSNGVSVINVVRFYVSATSLSKDTTAAAAAVPTPSAQPGAKPGTKPAVAPKPVPAPAASAAVPVRAQFMLSIPMAVSSADDATTPILGALPSLTPVTQTTSESNPGLTYDAAEDATDASSLPGPVLTRIQQWASAFSKDGSPSEQLYLLTGDKDPAHFYVGMGGWTAQVDSLGKAVPAPLDPAQNPPLNGGKTGLPGYVVRVNLVLSSPAPTAVAVRSAYDVWVAYDGTDGNPPVVAWLPAGSYTKITPYINARTRG